MCLVCSLVCSFVRSFIYYKMYKGHIWHTSITKLSSCPRVAGQLGVEVEYVQGIIAVSDSRELVVHTIRKPQGGTLQAVQ